MSLAQSYIKVVKVLAENIAQNFALNSRAENLDNAQDRLTVNYRHLFLHSIHLYTPSIPILDLKRPFFQTVFCSSISSLGVCSCVFNRQTHGVAALQALHLLPTK